MQTKLTKLSRIAATTGLHINKTKAKVMTINHKIDAIKLDGEALEEVDIYTYLGSVVRKDGGSDRDIQARVGKARTSFIILRPIWNAKYISTNTKLCIFNSNVKSVLLYGEETWRTTKASSNKLQSFINRCLRHILEIYWPKFPNGGGSSSVRRELGWELEGRCFKSQYGPKVAGEIPLHLLGTARCP